MKWSSFLVVIAISLISKALASNVESCIREVPEFRKCELMAPEDECSKVLEAITTLILSTDLRASYPAISAIKKLSPEAKDLIYKPWYFIEETTGNSIMFFGIIEVLIHCKNSLVLKSLRTEMNSYHESKMDSYGLSGLPDFNNDSNEILKKKIDLIFQKRLHDFIFTNPYKRSWTQKYADGIRFYSSTFEVAEHLVSDLDEESRIKRVKESLKAMWLEAENEIGFLDQETVEALMNFEYCVDNGNYNFDPSNEEYFTFVKDSHSEEANYYYGLAEENIQNLSGKYFVRVYDYPSEEAESLSESASEDERESESEAGNGSESEEEVNSGDESEEETESRSESRSERGEGTEEEKEQEEELPGAEVENNAENGSDHGIDNLEEVEVTIPRNNPENTEDTNTVTNGPGNGNDGFDSVSSEIDSDRPTRTGTGSNGNANGIDEDSVITTETVEANLNPDLGSVNGNGTVEASVNAGVGSADGTETFENVQAGINTEANDTDNESDKSDIDENVSVNDDGSVEGDKTIEASSSNRSVVTTSSSTSISSSTSSSASSSDDTIDSANHSRGESVGVATQKIAEITTPRLASSKPVEIIETSAKTDKFDYTIYVVITLGLFLVAAALIFVKWSMATRG